MLSLLRLYLYWAILWGFLVHPALGLKALAPTALLVMDLLMMAGTAAFTAGNLQQLNASARRQALLTGWMLLALTIYGIGITAINGGAIIEGAKYVAVLIRPVLLLLALYTYARLPGTASPQQLYATLKFDLTLLASAQMIVATVQLIDPTLGAEFIVSLGEQQSAIWALADGDVSGTFANSIELSYFLVATYMVITLGAWQARHTPSILVSAIFLYFTDATGSLAASIVLALYVAFLYLRCLPATQRRILYGLGIAAAGFGLQISVENILSAVIYKFDDMMLSRLGLVFISLPGVVENSPLKLLSGSGTDFNIVLNMLNTLPDVPLVFTYDDSATVINDVLWVALVLSLGLPMTLLYLYRIIQLIREFIGSQANPQRKSFLRMVLLVVFMAGMLNQILLVRSFVVPLFIGLTILGLRTTKATFLDAR